MFNFHYLMWGGVFLPTQRALADDLIDATVQADMQLVVPQGTINMAYERESMSPPDLEFATLHPASREKGLDTIVKSGSGYNTNPIHEKYNSSGALRITLNCG